MPLKSGDEYDVLTGWRKVTRHSRGETRAVKRRYWRRFRRTWKQHADKEK
ncbi:hypothetical protein GCM10009785_13720 [Brooklawnia cerclae]